MSKNINIETQVQLDEKSHTILNEKLKTFNLDSDMNYAVAVLKIFITNSESKKYNKLAVNVVPKVQFVVPFVSKILATEYMNELSKKNKLMMFLHVEKGNIVVKDEDIDLAINNLLNTSTSPEIEYEEISRLSLFNLIAYNWMNFSEQEKDEYAYKLGGLNGHYHIRALLDKWEFSPEFEKEVVNYI